MQKISKITTNVISRETELGNSRLEFKLSGQNIDYIVANTIRRTTMADVPIYAFNEFKFDKNSSVFHNNYLKLRLRHLPIWAIENTVEFIDYNFNTVNVEKEDNEDTDEDEVELQVEKTLNASTLKQLTMYINYKNKSRDIVSVTTSDAKFYYDEKQIPSPYKTPIPIVKLQPDQEIAFSAITKIGTEQEDAMYSAVCVSAYKQVNDNEFNMFLESRGQLEEKRILQVALINIERRLRRFVKLIQEGKTVNDDLEGVVVVNNEDNTLGNLIARGMQQHDKVDFAGYNLPHPLSKKVNFHYKLKKGGNIKKVIEDVVEYYSELFTQIKTQVDKF